MQARIKASTVSNCWLVVYVVCVSESSLKLTTNSTSMRAVLQMMIKDVGPASLGSPQEAQGSPSRPFFILFVSHTVVSETAV